MAVLPRNLDERRRWLIPSHGVEWIVSRAAYCTSMFGYPCKSGYDVFYASPIENSFSYLVSSVRVYCV